MTSPAHSRHTAHDHARRRPRLPSVTVSPEVLSALRAAAEHEPASAIVERALRAELELPPSR